MVSTELSHTLDMVSYGAYVMDLHRRILFWNRSAERILEYTPEQVVGRQCYEVLLGLPEQPATPACGPDCLTVRLAEERRIAPVANVQMRCASGARKRVSVMALPLPYPDTPVLVHLFFERSNESSTGGIGPSAQAGLTPHILDAPRESEAGGALYTRLTPRELEVVRLLATGERVTAISERLCLSEHTVLNYIRDAREKLHVATRLELVLAAQRLGLVQSAGGLFTC